MMALRNEPMPMPTSPIWMTTSEKSALKNRPMRGEMMSPTSEFTMAVNAEPTTTPTAMSSTLPRMAKALNSSKNFRMPLLSFSAIAIPLLLVPAWGSSIFYNHSKTCAGTQEVLFVFAQT